jgi:hypothetical protein
MTNDTKLWTDNETFISRELLENVVAVKPKRLSHKEEEELTLLLISKDKELKEVLQVSTVTHVYNKHPRDPRFECGSVKK